MTAAELLPKFRALFPEFDGEADAKVTIYLNLAIGTFAKCEDGTLYLAAHNLVMANGAGIGDASTTPTLNNNQDALALSSMHVNGKSASFVSTKDRDSVYTTTTYGLLFLQIKKACASYVFSIGLGGNVWR